MRLLAWLLAAGTALHLMLELAQAGDIGFPGWFRPVASVLVYGAVLMGAISEGLHWRGVVSGGWIRPSHGLGAGWLRLLGWGALAAHILHLRSAHAVALDAQDLILALRGEFSAVYYGVPWLALAYLLGSASWCYILARPRHEASRHPRFLWIPTGLFLFSALLVIQLASGGPGFGP